MTPREEWRGWMGYFCAFFCEFCRKLDGLSTCIEQVFERAKAQRPSLVPAI